MKYVFILLSGYIFLCAHHIIAMQSPYDSDEVSSLSSDSPPRSIVGYDDELYASSCQSDASSSSSNDERESLIRYMLDDLYLNTVEKSKNTQAISEEPKKTVLSANVHAPIQLKKKPSSFPGFEHSSALLIKPQSYFKQQLAYHDRLIVNKESLKIVTDEVLSPNKVSQCNYLAQKLIYIARLSPIKEAFSSWLLRSENDAWHIQYPFHLAINFGLRHWNEQKLLTHEDTLKYEQERVALGGNLSVPTDQAHVLKCIEILTDIGGNPNAPDHLGRRPLYLLPTSEDIEDKNKAAFKEGVAARLLFRSADINGANSQGDTALTRAAQVGDIPFLDFLLSQFADPNIQANKEDDGDRHILACGTSPLWAATQRITKDVRAVELLLKHNAKIKASELAAAQMMLATTDLNQSTKNFLEQVIATRE